MPGARHRAPRSPRRHPSIAGISDVSGSGQAPSYGFSSSTICPCLGLRLVAGGDDRRFARIPPDVHFLIDHLLLDCPFVRLAKVDGDESPGVGLDRDPRVGSHERDIARATL